jgi:hypothetical protein
MTAGDKKKYTVPSVMRHYVPTSFSQWRLIYRSKVVLSSRYFPQNTRYPQLFVQVYIEAFGAVGTSHCVLSDSSETDDCLRALIDRFSLYFMINQTPKIRTPNPNNRDKSNGRITAPSKPKWSSRAAVRNWEATIIVNASDRPSRGTV